MDNKTAGRAPSKEATIQRSVDLMVFEIGVGAYRQWLEESGLDPAEDGHALKAEALMVRYREPLQDMLDRHFRPFTELPTGTILTRTFRHAARPGNVKMMFEARLSFYKRFARWGMAHREDLNDVFKRKSRRVMREILLVADDEQPEMVVNKLASLQTVSGLNQTRNWLKNAAILCGEEVDATTEAIADTESAKTIARDLREVERQLEVADPVSDQAADLAFAREDIKEVLDETIDSARDPEAARTNAVDVISDGDLPEWVNEYGLNDEQKRVLLAKGNLLINAGAGSGKTHTMVAKIAYCVRELGYHPDQILATSFTRAASGEIKERVKDRFGIESENIGRTTHSIAGTLIRRFLPEIEKKRQNLFKGNANTKIGTCMKMAYKQLELQSWMSKGDKYYKRAIGADDPSLAWVNLGQLPSDALGRPIPQKTLEIIIGKMRASGLTLEEARTQHPNSESMAGAAVAMWASYEYLKEGNRQFGPIIDFDDMLKHGHAVLRDNPQARAQMQKQFKVVLVDEAQDQNIVQNEIFDMIGGQADILAYIGDDRQCAEENTKIMTPQGDVLAKDLNVGQEVFSYRNGKIVPQTVTHLKKSSWSWGYQIETESGRTLTMSPNHKIWASDPVLSEEEHLVYLMYRNDMGYRIGVTSTDSRDPDNSWGSRPHHEKADRLWVLDVCATKEDALYRESEISLAYGVPTQVFQAEKRGINPDRIAKIFAKFGDRGAYVLEAHDMRFDLPHWMSGSYSKHGTERRTIRMNAHSGSNTQVTLEWSGDDLDHLKNSENVTEGKNSRIRRYFASYQKALQYAQDLQEKTKANLCRRLSTPEGMLMLNTASGLHTGMSVAVVEGIEEGVVLEKIVSVQKVEGTFLDLQVDDASNFFGGGILSHNSIYAFRGASPQEFVSRKEKGFEVLTMTNNYRSGSNIVNAGEKLIEHNGDRQLPKTCRAVQQNGEGNIRNRTAETHEAAAASAVREISSSVKAGESPDNFGIVVRNNAEKDAFMIALISQGIPYRSASGSNFFKKPQVKCIINWLRVAVLDSGVELDNALLTAHEAPGFMLDRKFRSSVERVRGSRLDFIMEGGRDEVYTGRSSWRNKSVVEYGEAVRAIREAAQSVSGVADLIQRILSITGGVPIEKGGSEVKDVLYWMTEKVNIQELIADSEIDPDDISLELLRDEAKAPLSPLMAMAEKIPDPKRYLALISKLEGAMDRNNAKSKSPDNATEEHVPSVQIDTCHQWKGLEAENVYVMMAAGVWPNYRSDQAFASGDEEAYDEERRLAYVALTRGKQNVTILSPDVNYMGKDAGTSRFVSEACIPEEGIQNKEASVRTADVDVDVYEPGEIFTPEEFVDEFDMDMDREISLNPLGDLIYEAFIQGELK